MSATFWAKLDELIAVTARVVDAPTGNLGFGSDLACQDDLDPQFLELDGNDNRVIAEAMFRRLTTPRGTLADDPNYGLDVRAYLHRPGTASLLTEMQGAIRSEVEKDDRVEEGSTTVTVTQQDVKTITVFVSFVTASGPFSLTLAVTDSATLLKEFTANGNA
jgi:phage baseplate assembly protein W